jgi:hypothetical protein
MIKQAAGYDTANNDWRYEMRDAYGNLKAQPEAGKIQACITCHQAHKDRDFLPGSTIKN